MIPVIGLGSSATFATVARAEDASALEAVFQTMADLGARAFDTAPSYGASEQVAGAIVNELGIAYKLFAIFKQPKVDLIQVHNLGDPATQLPNVREFKKAGRVRYVGITTTWAPFFLEFTLTHPAITAVRRPPAKRRTCSTTSVAGSVACPRPRIATRSSSWWMRSRLCRGAEVKSSFAGPSARSSYR